jgi:formiminoglutamase
VSVSALPNDPKWPRAAHWLVPAAPGEPPECDLAIIGIPAHLTSISPTGAHATPAAVRDALLRYSTFSSSAGIDVSVLRALDLGDVEDPDGPEGERRVRAAIEPARERCELLVAIGGDNSITYSVLRGLSAGDLGDWGLVTIDAHHDLRDGETNGSPVRRLIAAGLPGANIVQIGIADFANSAAYAERARGYGITVTRRDVLRRHTPADVVAEALEIAGGDGRPVFVDIDVDVCDRATAPACPSSAPGGVSADELRQMAFLFARDPRVKGMDITEIDAEADAPDRRTVRLAALLILEAAAGLAESASANPVRTFD